MPRQGRINIEGGIYHIIQRGLEKREIFLDDEDRREFLRRLKNGLEETGHKCYAWVLMPNHFHLLIRSGVKPSCDLMRKLSTGYALYFNKKHDRCGYLYQGRYKSVLCQEESYFLQLIRYIHLNPLRAKIVKDLREFEIFLWSGHSVLLGINHLKWQSTGEVLGRFGKSQLEAVKKYREFVLEAKDIGRRDELSGGGLIRSAGGWEEVKSLRESKSRLKADERILGDGQFVDNALQHSERKMKRHEKFKKEGWNIKKLEAHVCKLTNIKEGVIIGKKKKSNIKAKGLLAYWGVNELGIKGAELGRYLGISKQAISYLIKKGEKTANEDGLYLSI
ncbi:MAG: hypothetical protein A2297_05605 [Elusimicrobia bacterium RIFOXYB2_FULL_48_7]|nr:MAG: hypothetical protein A2297_05605 [Elusimicrobia bacterium RIFOXYB2_FULL_48_7]